MPNETDILPGDEEPFIALKDIFEATDKFANEVETIAAQDRVPRGWTDELAGGISSFIEISADKVEAFITAFAPSADGADYAETQHEDEHFHLGRPPFRNGFLDLAPPGEYESTEARYWAGFSYALSNGYAEKYQNPYLEDAALQALDEGLFEIFFGEIGG